MSATTQDPFGGRSAYRIMALGSAWLIAMRWSMRGIGLVSTLVLARFLSPEAFGIVAVAMVVVGLVEALAETGERLALLRLAEPTRADYDTAWSLSVLVGAFVGLVLFALAHPATAFVGDPRVVPVLQVLAIKPLILGLENIGTIDFQRRFDYARDFRFGLSYKLVSVAVTILAAITLRSHWALVAGMLAGAAARTMASYVLSPYRPRLSLASWRGITGFSVWTLGAQLARFAADKLDRAVAGRGVGTGALGVYTVAAEIATAFSAEIVTPVARALLPVYARIQHDRAELAAKYRTVLTALGHLCFAIGAGLALVSERAVAVLLGSGWQAAVPLLAWLSLAAALQLLAATVLTVLNAAGQARRGAVLSWVQTGLLLPALLLGLAMGGIEGMAAARAGVALLCVPLSLLAVRSCLGLGFGALAAALLRPALATAAMAATVLAVEPMAAALAPAILGLVLEVTMGAATYTAAALLLWQAAGRPEGLELVLVQVLRRRMRPALPAGPST